MPVSPVCSVSFRPAAGGGPRTPAVSSAPHPRTRGRCGSPAGLHPLIPVTSMRLPLPVLTVMAVSRGNLPETSPARAPLGALRPFLILKSKSGRPVSLNPILEPRLRYHLEQTLPGMQAPYPWTVCPTHQDITVPPSFSFLRPRAGLHSAQWPPTASDTPTRANGTKPTSHLCGPKGRGPGSSAMGGTM